MDMCCLSEWMLTPPFLPAACCHGDVVRRAGAITPWALPAVVFLFFLLLLSLLSALLFCCRRFQSNYLPSPFHKYLLHTHSYSSWVTSMQRFFPLIHFILLPLCIALVLSPAEESQVSHCSPLWCPSFSLVVLTDLSLLISLKEKPILHCTSFDSHLVDLLCALLYIH